MGCVESEVKENESLTPEMEKFLSGFKLGCYNLQDEGLRASQFEFIVEEFTRKFDKSIGVDTLHEYYDC